MIKTRNTFLWLAAMAGIIVFVGDFLITLILGVFYPNYNHLKIVMSELGTWKSPVALWINLWWSIFGTLFIVFGVGFRKAFLKYSKTSLWGMLLIIIFGVGAWTAGGIFPMEPGGVETTLSGKLHGIFGGLGYLALLFVPLVLLPLFPRTEKPKQYWASLAAFMAGVITFNLFIASKNNDSVSVLFSFPGLWQRLFLFVHYAYLSMIAILMIQKSRASLEEANGSQFK